MAQTTLKDFFPSAKKTKEGNKDNLRKRSLDSYTVPRGKKRKVAAGLRAQKDKLNVVLSSSKKAKRTTLQPSSTATPVVDLSMSKVATEGALNETTSPSPRGQPKNTKASSSSSPLSRGATCLKLALDKDKSPLISRGKEQLTSFKEARRKLFSESSEGSTSSSTKVKDEEPSNQPVNTSFVPSPMKKKQHGTPDSKSTPKLNHFKALQYDSPTKQEK